MRNLNVLNAAAKSTKFMFAISLVIPLFMGWSAWALAMGAAPELPLHENFLEEFGLGIMLLAVAAWPIPYVFRWNWETKYFGASLFALTCGSIGGIYPVLCIVRFGSLPLFARLAIILLESAAIIQWCSRFVKVYKLIYADSKLFAYIYEEESTAVYYLQQGDKKVVGHLLKFNQLPKSRYFVLSLLAAFSLVPFASSVSQFVGTPFTHVFLAICAVPINLMFSGLATKLWLVCYFYPMKIRKETGKVVYVDMSSRPLKFINSTVVGGGA